MKVTYPVTLDQEVYVEFNDTLSIGMDDFSDSENMKIPEILPMMAVRDVVIFNYMIIPLFVGRPGSVEAVNEALNERQAVDARHPEGCHQRQS